MASKTLLFLLGLTIIAVAYGAWLEGEDDTEEVTVEDLQNYFTTMEKRGSKLGRCNLPNGKSCAICNLKVKNPKDMRRYIACSAAGNGRTII